VPSGTASSVRGKLKNILGALLRAKVAQRNPLICRDC